jgi:site-specific DNA recombinase
MLSKNASLRTAMYARVSSDQQAEANTIASQIADLEQRIAADGYTLEDDARFIDDGLSGTTLRRPALERLRDQIANGVIDRLYVHAPDRLARKFALQALLLDEFNRAGVEVVFLNHALGKSPEDDLLLQVQGVIAEYERCKIIERIRRGKLHSARSGNVSVLGAAPFGYRYVTLQEGGGQARYDVVAEQAAIVQQLFCWVGRDRLSLGEVARRLEKQGILTPRGGRRWTVGTLGNLLSNPAYIGQAQYGKRRLVEQHTRLRPLRGQPPQSRRPFTLTRAGAQPLPIAVPAIVSAELFAAVAEQLAENRRRYRPACSGASYLLQGLLVCAQCGYAYCGRRRYRNGKRLTASYYYCTGRMNKREAEQPRCRNSSIAAAQLDAAVWRDVCDLLREPTRLEQEYQRRLHGEAEVSPRCHNVSARLKQVKRGIGRLIDAYSEGLIEKEEFEPKIQQAKKRLQHLEAEAAELANEDKQRAELRLVIGKLEEFTARLHEGLEGADWHTRREIIRALVKQIELSDEQIRIVYRVSTAPFVNAPNGGNAQDCRKRCNAMKRLVSLFRCTG